MDKKMQVVMFLQRIVGTLCITTLIRGQEWQDLESKSAHCFAKTGWKARGNLYLVNLRVLKGKSRLKTKPRAFAGLRQPRGPFLRTFLNGHSEFRLEIRVPYSKSIKRIIVTYTKQCSV